MTSQVFTDRWRSGLYVGQAQPRTVVRIQRGLLDRAYREFQGEDNDFGYIGGSKHNDAPWHAFWRATGDWIDLPNVQQVASDLAFQQQSGMADPEAVTITVDNVIYEEVIGVAGTYHRFSRGHLSPWRGWTNGGQRPALPGARRNEWFDTLNGGYRLRIWQGYGDALEPVFTGLIDDTNVSDTPDQIALACRSFHAVLTDQRVFGNNKAKELRSPIVFHDRLRADATKVVGGAASASTAAPAHPAIGITKPGSNAWWLSHAHTTPDNTEWCQVKLPRGRYNEFYVAPGYEEMEMYLSVYARHNGISTRAKIDGVEVNDGWVSAGLGNVPGSNGGHPFVFRWGRVGAGGMKRKLPFTLECGDDTVLRVSFRRLGKHAEGDYRAKCSRLAAFKAKRKPSASKEHWILVDDASDCIKWALMWAGFKNWHVEPMGVRLKGRVTFDQTTFLNDIIKHFVDQADFTFFVQGFDDTDEADIGTPHFEPIRAIRDPNTVVQEVSESDLLTDIELKFTKEPLAYIIRYRGKQTTEKDPEQGVPLGQDSTKRVMATYLPPWSGAHHDVATGQYDADYPFAGRLAGNRRHELKTDDNIETYDEAMMACILFALREALAAMGARVEIPGNPTLLLNDQISVVDTASGANSRVWIISRATSWTGGEQPEFRTTLQGAMVDSPDVFLVALDYLRFLDAVLQEAAL